MRSSLSEPYLWVHLAGIAAVPIFLELCLLGLAAAESWLPASLVILLVAVAGIAPIAWMQWKRPFNIFSLMILALKPSELTESQRRILTQFKAPVEKAVTVIATIGAAVLLWQLNRWVPLVTLHSGVVPGGGLGGLLLAAVAFLLSNLFLQVPASVLPVLLTSESKLAAISPYPAVQISKDFTSIGIQVKQILPPLVSITPSSSNVNLAPEEPLEAASHPANQSTEPDEVAVTFASLESEPVANLEDDDEDDWIDSDEEINSPTVEATEELTEDTAEPPLTEAAPNVADTIVTVEPPNSTTQDEPPLEEDRSTNPADALPDSEQP